MQVYVCGERLALCISYGEQWGAFVKDRHGGKLRSSNDDGDNDVESEGKVYMLQKGSTTISMLTQHNTTRFCNPPPNQGETVRRKNKQALRTKIGSSQELTARLNGGK